MKRTDIEIKSIIRQSLSASYQDILHIVRTGGSCGSDRFCKLYYEVMGEDKGINDVELIMQNVKLAAQQQKQADLNRIKNKAFREDSRLNNAMTVIGMEIIEILKSYDFSKITIKHDKDGGEQCSAILHLSDMHLNELVSTQMNTYDFEIAAKRLQKFARRASEYLILKGVKTIIVANTGDILNSDRRLDEYMSMATNRMNATMLAVFLIEQFLVDLNRHFNIVYIQVSGNESRVKDEPGYTDVILTDNYDSLIYNILKHLMKTSKGITFLDGDVAEQTVSLMGQKILVTHGDQISNNGTTGDCQKIVGKYAQEGEAIDFIIFGHIHSANVSDFFARGSSMVGANAYSDRALQVAGRASQNLHIFYRDGSRDSLVIDLQNTDGYMGYEIKEQLVAYNAKSEKKLHHAVVIHEVVV